MPRKVGVEKSVHFTMTLQKDTLEMLRKIAERDHKFMSQTITDWVWKEVAADPKLKNGISV